MPFERALDDLDGSDDARAKPARLGKDHMHDGSLRCFPFGADWSPRRHASSRTAFDPDAYACRISH
jgi:hypothetical protein